MSGELSRNGKDHYGRIWPWYTMSEWRAAYDRAAAELGLPPRGPRGTPQNRVRRSMRAVVAARAWRIVWLERGDRRAEGRV